MSYRPDTVINYILNSDEDRAASAISTIANDSRLTAEQKQFQLGEALMAAVEKGNQAIVTFLLKNGANPNYVNLRGETPLDIAKQNGNIDIIKLLTERSAAQTVGTTSNSSGNSSSSGGRRRKLKNAKKTKKSKKSRKSKKGKKYTRRSA